jgi:3-oxoacyl-(acyl-carrier-protein) synthase
MTTIETTADATTTSAAMNTPPAPSTDAAPRANADTPIAAQRWIPRQAAAQLAADSGMTALAGAYWPRPDAPEQPKPVPGFILSSFAPLVAQVAQDCLAEHYGTPSRDLSDEVTIGIVLVSVGGDLGTADATQQAVDGGGRVSPLLFFQSVPNSIAGWLAARWGLTGPLICFSPGADALGEARETARLLFEDAVADQVLVVLVEQAGPDGGGAADQAAAVLLEQPPNTRH